MHKSEIENKLREIDEHFENITASEFEANLEKAGVNEIESMKESGLELL